LPDNRQLEIALPRRTRDDYAREQLAAAIEEFNATTEPARRVELHAEISRLRAQLGLGG
jgi:hypothetical protein